MSDSVSEDTKLKEPITSREDYLDRLKTPLERWSKIIRTPSGGFIEQHYQVINVEATGPINWKDAYDFNQAGTHTSGRRGRLDNFLENGIEPFSTEVNEGLNESPAVVFGHLKPGEALPDSETFRRDYGDIFDQDSKGYIVVVGPEITKTPDYEPAGAEARVKVTVTPKMIKAIIVGNETTERETVDLLKSKGVTLPVIRMSKSETPL